jgi:leucyl-tRNA synthetase
MTDFFEISRKWQKKWADSNIFRFDEKSQKPKHFTLEMFPYPSAYGLHMGHARNYAMGDVIARFKRMQGFNVLYPMGYDAFGLPAENAAIKNKTHPRIYTEIAIKSISKQQRELGNSYDWSKMFATCDPAYYKWNQWFFLQFYKRGLAYRKEAPINWCPKCETVLANEQVKDGRCWRCDSIVEIRNLEQWFLRITQYADELLENVKKLDGWPEKIRIMQENWIGKSEGVNIDFPLEGSDRKLTAFTTRCDTIYSVTFIVIAPEHPLVLELSEGTPHESEVKKVVAQISEQSIIERSTTEGKDKFGAFLGKYAVNPVSGQRIPIYVANFALNYGTGIVMADAHDERDFEFARKYNIPLKFVISPDGKPKDASTADEAYTDDGILFDSGEFSGMHNREALPKMAQWLEERVFGKRAVNFKLRDWLISRQRYWGTPIPMIYCEKCGVVPVPEDQLPVLLPDKVEFTGQGNPLLQAESFVNTTCPQCHGKARRETDTMDTFMDSSWYFLRFCDPHNHNAPFAKDKVDNLMPVNQYIGGAEHAVMHLLYARFFTYVLRDMGMVGITEPFAKLFNQGIVYKDGAKMSKSFGNVVSQDEIASKYGIDTARLFLLFVASPESELEWSDEGVEGSYRFLRRLYAALEERHESKSSAKDAFIESKRNRCTRAVTGHIEAFELNKAIIAIMEFSNVVAKHKADVSSEQYTTSMSTIAHLLLPFTPHIAEEMHERLGGDGFLSLASWPSFDESKISDRAEADQEYTEEMISNIRKNLQLKGKEKPESILLYQAQEWKYAFVRRFRELFASIKNPGQMSGELLKDPSLASHKDEAARLTGAVMKNMKLLPEVDRSAEEERQLLEQAAAVLEAEFGCSVVIGDPTTSSDAKAKNGLPGRPAIVLN